MYLQNYMEMFTINSRCFLCLIVHLHIDYIVDFFSTGFIIWRDLNAFKAKTNWNEIFMHSIVIAFESIKDVVYT